MRKIRFNLLQSGKKSGADRLIPLVATALILLDLLCLYRLATVYPVISREIRGIQPDTKRAEKIIREARELSGIVPDIGFRMSSLFNELETILPDSVLVSEVRVNGGLVRISGESGDKEELRDFLKKLEKKPFNSPFLSNQRQSGGTIEFKVECRFEK